MFLQCTLYTYSIHALYRLCMGVKKDAINRFEPRIGTENRDFLTCTNFKFLQQVYLYKQCCEAGPFFIGSGLLNAPRLRLRLLAQHVFVHCHKSFIKSCTKSRLESRLQQKNKMPGSGFGSIMHRS